MKELSRVTKYVYDCNEGISEISESLKEIIRQQHEILLSINSLISINRDQHKEDHLLSDDELALKLKVSTRTVRNYKQKGILKAIRIGGHDYYRESDIFN